MVEPSKLGDSAEPDNMFNEKMAESIDVRDSAAMEGTKLEPDTDGPAAVTGTEATESVNINVASTSGFAQEESKDIGRAVQNHDLNLSQEEGLERPKTAPATGAKADDWPGTNQEEQIVRQLKEYTVLLREKKWMTLNLIVMLLNKQINM